MAISIQILTNSTLLYDKYEFKLGPVHRYHIAVADCGEGGGHEVKEEAVDVEHVVELQVELEQVVGQFGLGLLPLEPPEAAGEVVHRDEQQREEARAAHRGEPGPPHKLVAQGGEARRGAEHAQVAGGGRGLNEAEDGDVGRPVAAAVAHHGQVDPGEGNRRDEVEGEPPRVARVGARDVAEAVEVSTVGGLDADEEAIWDL